MRFGKTLVIQEMDGVEPVLFPLLRGDLMSQGQPHVVINQTLILINLSTSSLSCA